MLCLVVKVKKGADSHDFFIFQIHCSEFMEFPEVENLHDFSSCEDHFIHVQDHRGFYIVYDVALKDLDELKNELLLVGSHFIHRHGIKQTEAARTGNVDHVAVLLHLWKYETEFLESKVQVVH